MYRMAIIWLSLAVIVGLASCNSAKKQKFDDEAAPPADAGPLDITPDEEPTTPATAEEPEVETITPDEPAGGPIDLQPSTHIVQKGDTLYRLARFYYDDQTMWKRIWEANRDQIPDPNTLKIGQELIIP